mmetsp:Transcript_37125/g.78366  ORF Transcript_37125/g.78366 Transcript_37125/m.78366 type:complete len:98 (+) Transcript_37125:601-894(+)
MVSFSETLQAIAQIDSQLEENDSSSRQKWHIHQESASKILNIDDAKDTTGAAVLGEFVNCIKDSCRIVAVGRGKQERSCQIPHPTIRRRLISLTPLP